MSHVLGSTKYCLKIQLRLTINLAIRIFMHYNELLPSIKLPKCDSEQRFRSRQLCLRRRRTAGENGRFPYTKIIVNISFGLWHQE